MSASRPDFQPLSLVGARKRSNGLLWNSLEVSALATSPPVAAPTPFQSGASSGNHGTTSRSASIVESGPVVQAIADLEGAEGIGGIILEPLADTHPAQYNFMQ